MNMVALIPARAGSKRIPGKNMKVLGGKPLIQWTVEAARASGVFRDIVCSTESEIIAATAGCSLVRRPPEFATDESPDIFWVRHALTFYPQADAFAILRPTSPFRTAATIRRAFTQFLERPCDSLRAVEPAKQHPMKMWRLGMDHYLEPAFRAPWERVPYHSCPTQTLPRFYIQNASLEMAWTHTVVNDDSISGRVVVPFFTQGDEGFDINTPEDWAEAERLVSVVTV